MGYMFVIGNCIACGIMFSFNADHVPSVSIDGIREPICKDCVARINVIREGENLQPVWVHPEAYEPQEVQ